MNCNVNKNRKLIHEKYERPRKKGAPPMLHGAMHYQCKDCGLRWRMWLEVGVEGKDKKQPCPFSIPCECGGVAQHVDWQKDHFLSAPRPAYPGMNYFALDRGGKKEMACGKPMVYVGDE